MPFEGQIIIEGASGVPDKKKFELLSEVLAKIAKTMDTKEVERMSPKESKEIIEIETNEEGELEHGEPIEGTTGSRILDNPEVRETAKAVEERHEQRIVEGESDLNRLRSVLERAI